MTNTLTSNEILKHSKSTEISLFNACYVALTRENITIEAFLNRVKTGEGFKDKIQRIRQELNKEMQGQLKQHLPCVSVSVLFDKKRDNQNIKSYSGFMQIDFDDVENLYEKIDLLQKDKYSYSVFISPSGKGIKVIVKVPLDKNQHITSFLQLQDYYKNTYDLIVDKQCKDIGRLLFLSWDEDIFINEDSFIWEILPTNNRNLFISLLESFSQKERFTKGNRNHYIFKLSLLCCKERIKLDEAIQFISEKYTSPEFSYQEIERAVKSGYKSKYFEKSTPEPEADESSKSFSKLKRAELFLSNKYDIRLNEVNGRIEVKIKDSNEQYKELKDANLYIELEHENISLGMQKLLALLQSDFVPSYNPFISYFKSLEPYDKNKEPDYIERLCEYLPVTDMDRFKIQFKKMLVRCIACALENSVFNKHVFVLVGEGQNTGKSTFCRWLCPPALSEYIVENINTDKDGLIALATNFFINMDELASFTKTEINLLKSFISKEKINIRHPYARRSTVDPRRANFLGSTNNIEFLTDVTGSVRWLCFELTGKMNFAYSKEIQINDIWRQAFQLYTEGFEYQLTQKEIVENEATNSKFLISSFEVQLVDKYFRPATKETGIFHDATEISLFILNRHSGIKLTHVAVGRALKTLGFTQVSQYIPEKGYSKKGYYVEIIYS